MIEKEITRPLLIGNRSYQVASDDEYLDSMDGTFEPYSVALFKTLVKPGDVALDIGANIGCTALLLSQTAGQVVAFEPGSRTFELLATNTANAANVRRINVGLGSKAAELDLVFSPKNRSGGFVSVNGAEKGQVGQAKERIKIERGDDFIRNEGLERVDFIKIDTEGFERDVLTGLAETIRQQHPVVTLELNHWCLNAFHRISVPDFLDFLRSIFPVLYAFHVDEAKNLHNEGESFEVIRDHILTFKYMSIVGAFDESQIEDFLQLYVRKSARYIQLEAQHQADFREISELRETGHRLRKEVTALHLQLDASTERERSLVNEVAAIKSSQSWKVTSPLRALRRLLR